MPELKLDRCELGNGDVVTLILDLDYTGSIVDVTRADNKPFYATQECLEKFELQYKQRIWDCLEEWKYGSKEQREYDMKKFKEEY